MSLATLIEEAPLAEIETAETVTIQASITPGGSNGDLDTVAFSAPVPVDGVTVSDSTITVNRSNARFNFAITLMTPGYTFQTPAILWITPPQRGFNSDPFGILQINPEPGGTVAKIPNTTGAAGSPQLTTRFALYLRNSSGQSVIIDPTIVDDPNT